MSLAYAAAAGNASAQQGGALGMFLPLLLMILVFYFFLIRPQQKKAKTHQTMLNNLKKGDKIITIGGILGTIVGLKDSMLEIQISENVNIKITKDSVAKVVVE